MKKRIIKHGEAVFVEVIKPNYYSELESSKLTSKNSVNGKLIVANSETSGNHHVLEIKDSIFKESSNKIFIENFEDVELSCVHAGRHDACLLPVPQKDHIWQRNIAQEWDYLEQEKRNVAD